MARSGWLLNAGFLLSGLTAITSVEAGELCNGFRSQYPHRGCERLWESSREWYLHLGGASSHSEDTRAPGRHWNDRHAGIGIESRRAGLPWRDTESGERWRTSYTLGTFEDSRRFWSLYSGAAFTRELVTIGGTRIDAGAGAFVFYRSTSWSGKMAWVPAVLPVMSVTDKTGPVGFNMIWRPPGTDGPSTVFLQITHRFQ